MKSKRQKMILELIEQQSIETQDELLELLSKAGFNVTQATISRDIKELKLVKISTANGKYRYVASKSDMPDSSARFYSLFKDSVWEVNYGMNTVCIKCHIGMAQAVCASMDTVITKWNGIIGTLSGDDTIFILCKDVESAKTLTEQLTSIF